MPYSGSVPVHTNIRELGLHLWLFSSTTALIACAPSHVIAPAGIKPVDDGSVVSIHAKNLKFGSIMLLLPATEKGEPDYFPELEGELVKRQLRVMVPETPAKAFGIERCQCLTPLSRLERALAVGRDLSADVVLNVHRFGWGGVGVRSFERSSQDALREVAEPGGASAGDDLPVIGPAFRVEASLVDVATGMVLATLSVEQSVPNVLSPEDRIPVSVSAASLDVGGIEALRRRTVTAVVEHLARLIVGTTSPR